MINRTLLDATCLAHAVRGVSLQLTASSGAKIVVSSNCLDADMSPCQLRGALLTEGVERELHRGIVDVQVQSGAVHLGGGIYQPTQSDATERWFVTSLPPSQISTRLTVTGDGQVADDRFGVTLRADPELGRTCVGVYSIDPGLGHAVDDVAAQAMAACLVEELISEIADVRSAS